MGRVNCFEDHRNNLGSSAVMFSNRLSALECRFGMAVGRDLLRQGANTADTMTVSTHGGVYSIGGAGR